MAPVTNVWFFLDAIPRSLEPPITFGKLDEPADGILPNRLKGGIEDPVGVEIGMPCAEVVGISTVGVD